MPKGLLQQNLKRGATGEKKPLARRSRMRHMLADMARRWAAKVAKAQDERLEGVEKRPWMSAEEDWSLSADMPASTPPMRKQQRTSPSLAAQEFASPCDPSDAAVWHMRILRPALLRQEAALEKCEPFVSLAVDWPDVVQWLVGSIQDWDFRSNTLFLAMHLASRFFATRKVPRNRLYLLAATSLTLASKFEEEAAPAAQALVELGMNQFVAEEVHLMELAMLKHFAFQLHVPTAAHYLEWIHVEWCSTLGGGNYWQRQLAEYVAELGFGSPHYVSWAPSHHAAAAVLLSHFLLQPSRPWLRVVQTECFAGDTSQQAAVEIVVKELFRVIRSVTPQSAIYQKFDTAELGQLSTAAAQLVAAVSDQQLLQR